MPLLFVLFALLGVGLYAHEELRDRPAAVVQATIAPAHSPWARACQVRLDRAAREFEARAQTGCHSGVVTIATLSSGVDYVEYQLRTADGGLYQVAVTEEPQNSGEPSGWRGAPRCLGSYNDFEAVRHDNGRLALVQAQGESGFLLANTFEAAADFCLEQPQ